MRCIVTGGAGFFGSIMCEFLLDKGEEVLSIDILPLHDSNARYRNVQCDIADKDKLKKTIEEFGKVDAIFHCAAVLAHVKEKRERLWATNVDGTRNIMEIAQELKIPKVIFTSTYCVFSKSFQKAVDEDTPTHPIEDYGRSKLEGERLLQAYPGVQGVAIRCPSIIQAGRLGLLTILFDFVREGRRLYVVNGGNNHYSFIAAKDLANACWMAARCDCAGLYHIGSDNVPTLRQVYSDLQVYAGKKPRLASVPQSLTTLGFSVLNALGLSPLSPYHYKMMSANLVSDTTRLKRDIGWQPTMSNSEIMCEAYQYYVDHLDDFRAANGNSPHKQPAKMGVLNLLRLIS